MDKRPEGMVLLERGRLGRQLGADAAAMDHTDGSTGPEDRTVAKVVKLETLLVGEREIRAYNKRSQ